MGGVALPPTVVVVASDSSAATSSAGLWFVATVSVLDTLVAGALRGRSGGQGEAVASPAEIVVRDHNGSPRLVGLFRAGQRPGPGRFRCDVHSWVVRLDDAASEMSTGPSAVTLDVETRPADAKLPPCLGCGGLGDEPIFERVIGRRLTAPRLQTQVDLVLVVAVCWCGWLLMVASVAAIRAGDAGASVAYYVDQVSHDRHDYYAGHGEAPGV